MSVCVCSRKQQYGSNGNQPVSPTMASHSSSAAATPSLASFRRAPRRCTFVVESHCSAHVLCGACSALWVDPVKLAPCGHVVCATCVGDDPACPSCAGPIGERTGVRPVLRALVAGLRVRCTLCAWGGTYASYLSTHEPTCTAVPSVSASSIDVHGDDDDPGPSVSAATSPLVSTVSPSADARLGWPSWVPPAEARLDRADTDDAAKGDPVGDHRHAACLAAAAAKRLSAVAPLTTIELETAPSASIPTIGDESPATTDGSFSTLKHATTTATTTTGSPLSQGDDDATPHGTPKRTRRGGRRSRARRLQSSDSTVVADEALS